MDAAEDELIDVGGSGLDVIHARSLMTLPRLARMPEALLEFRCIDASQADLMGVPAGVEDRDRIAIMNAHDMAGEVGSLGGEGESQEEGKEVQWH